MKLRFSPTHPFLPRSFKRKALCVALSLCAAPAFADAPTSMTMVGDQVTNPDTDMLETVSQVVTDTSGNVLSVITSSQNYIAVPVMQDQLITTTEGIFQVLSVTTNADGEMTEYTLQEAIVDDMGMVTGHTGEIDTVPVVQSVPSGSGGSPATSLSSSDVPASGPVSIINHGKDGDNGHAGGGVWIFSYPPSDGDDGGNGPNTNITVGTDHPEITSTASDAAIQVASVGGDGGNGGDFIGVAGDGANGGESGDGGNVTLENNADVSLDNSDGARYGIYAYSQSGKGGNGGDGIIWSGGGDSGGSTEAGTVTVTNNGNVTTSADDAHGIYALSAAGAAGTAGDSWGIVGVGGTGADAGDGNTVTVTNNGSVSTGGASAHGIFAQSVGGTGGASGDAGGLVALGGSGGDGGKGGVVTVTNNGSINTAGDSARGIFAQSIGGGGGTGGDGGGAVAIGGTGGTGNNSAAVTVENTGSVGTAGKRAAGIFAQSVGGGGGDGGTTGGLVTIGGNGSAGGDGGTVEVSQSGAITTTDTESYGIFAQSVGGGGGNGGGSYSGSLFAGFALGGDGSSGGDGGNVTVTLDNYSAPDPMNPGSTLTIASSISTQQDQSLGIFAQSVGGGGGNGGTAVQATVGAFGAVSVALGGKGGDGGEGGTVNLNGTGTVTTAGDSAVGALVQSVGGGGGNGGMSISVAAAAGPASGAVSVSVGGSAGDGGDGGTVNANYNGDIATQGDVSSGLVVQSIGGGGGNGGTAISGAASFALTASTAIPVGVGGTGGDGGIGGTVDVTIGNGGASTVSTGGSQATGILAQSVGGGGGNGGMSIAGALSAAGTASGALTVSVGGSGGAGQNAGTVNADVTSDVTTTGDASNAVIVQSIGGGGGNGGLSVSAGASGAGVASGSVSVSVGGSGNGGGDGNTVAAEYSGDARTTGDNAVGILAQSVGGGGGNGGGSVAANFSGAGTASGAIGLALGGSGSVGGDGGTGDDTAVTLTTAGTVTTEGDNAGAIVAQSIGGGGGNGGFSVSASISGAGTGSGAANVGLGGSGDAGGVGKDVEATVNSTVVTGGNNASGVLAQSVGGGGGNGGFNVSANISGAGTGSGAIAVGLGGSGGAGGNSGDVTLTTTDTVTTNGETSTAVIAQSIGGGGGNGGFNVSAGASGAGTGSGSASVGLGGSGDAGGNAGNATATTRKDIATSGHQSGGVLVQSVGGGGGNGGFNVAASLSGAGTASGAVSVGLGGSGGGGGNAAQALLTSTHNVNTQGDDGSAIVVQSIGGGGGNGAFNVSATVSGAGTASGAVGVGLGGAGGGGGDADLARATVTGDMNTGGKNAQGLLVQSVGGGGGNGGFNVTGTIAVAGTGSGGASVGLGGSGGDGGNAGSAQATLNGDITTLGQGGAGFITQSIGGGGGNGGIDISGTITAAGEGSGAASVSIGGSGGGGGNASTVDQTLVGDVTTQGDNAGGVLAQSLGGGGGNGGLSVAGAVSLAGTGSGAAAIGIGGSGGSGGFASDVTNDVTGFVQSQGDDASGIVAQSIGGGGGNGGIAIAGAITAAGKGSGSVAVAVGGMGGDGGAAGAVTNTVEGSAATTGDHSTGIMAQSLGGGGGNGGLSVAGSLTLSQQFGGAIGVGIGGFGGKGGHSANVISTVNTTDAHSAVTTQGDHASAVVAQSIAGGGGNGGLNVTGTVSVTGESGATLGVGIGGFGGEGGNAGDVALTLAGDVATWGDDAHGVVAQSVAGGGGQGGLNVTGGLAVSYGNGSVGSVNVGIGGFGGEGGNAGAVAVDYTGSIEALPREWVAESVDADTGDTVAAHYESLEDKASRGLFAQSLGGGGGVGGINITGGIGYALGTDAKGGALSFGIGGFGGNGGNASTVAVNVNAGAALVEGSALQHIYASGDDHAALTAQSLGGGGGQGAINVSGGIASDAPLVFGLGGAGGDAGTASDATVIAVANVEAAGANAGGIVAQSIGGGGGNGGLNVSGGLTVAKSADIPSITVGIGGAGGAGSISGDTLVDHAGTIATAGEWSHGILSQSLAGGGGNGGLNVSGQINWADSTNSGGATDLTIVAGVGGSAGTGADSGAAAVVSTGNIATEGDYARGIFAQSLGGGGGTGGMNVTGVFTKDSSPITVSVGGSGGAAGNADTASVNRGTVDAQAGLITTDGIGAVGIEAASIGGGGGDAGMNITAGFSLAGSDGGSAANAMQLNIGGSGAAAGNGAAADITHVGNVVTAQDESHGLFAQSIGGGGGNATLNLSLVYEDKNKENKALAINVGGGTGVGGQGDAVSISHTGDVDTLGSHAHAVFAQSVGGGGGNAGLTMAYNKVSGGKMDITIGTEGADGGSGGNVVVDANGNLITVGEGSHGVLAQSVGNGGGNSNSTSVSVTGASTEGESTQGASLSVGLEGGKGGVAGDVNVDMTGLISTTGATAYGIFAQSVGGGGGNGGSASGSGASAALAIGGNGGEGGIGGKVEVDSSALLGTLGDGAIGILAQSVGGGGGTGGMVKTGMTPADKGTGVSVLVGGGGGTGMTGGEVNVSNSGIITTQGSNAYGVLAQSLGGGGGNAGMVLNTLQNSTGDNATRLDISVGGDGGEGAASGLVSVNNSGRIATADTGAIAIFAQSVGGGGGNADTVVTGSLTTKGGANKMSFSIGGDGGTGGTGGDVTVVNRPTASDDLAEILTMADNAHGIFAMSVGGGGGMGSTAITANVTKGTGDSAASAFAFALGGSGGTGGTSGVVDVTNDGDITTVGNAAHGVVAQSIGGGGGEGGLALAGNLTLGTTSGDTDTTNRTSSIAVGGSGGSGNTSGDVVVNNSGTITVYGEGSYGVFAQSIGGGGGNGGFAASISNDLATNPKTNLAPFILNAALGGSGGDGADSGNVSVTHTGSITAHGDNAYGIFAQSISGGGGTAQTSISSPIWTAVDYTMSTLMGVKDGSTGTAGTVTLNTTGDITMLGANSQAHFVQSVNGGGGDALTFIDISQQAAVLGDDSVDIDENDSVIEGLTNLVKGYVGLGVDSAEDAVGSDIVSTHFGSLWATGDDSTASQTQSIGGGGGNNITQLTTDDEATIDLELSLGGSVSDEADDGATYTGNHGGDITLALDGNLQTDGERAQGLVLQSIGGGGGKLTTQVMHPEATSSSDSDIAQAPSINSVSKVASLALGAYQGSNNNGGNITFTLDGNVNTQGDASAGLLVQSIGAGGGTARVDGLDSVGLSLGGRGDTQGNAGNIAFTNTGSVVTQGAMSHGVIVQSIGGGGGTVYSDVNDEQLAITLNSDNTGNGGNISFSQTGDVVTFGDGAHGVVLQSLGGGGGLVNDRFAGSAGGEGIAGDITLTVEGSIAAMGNGSDAILLQSEAVDGQGDIAITIGADYQIVGGHEGAGVHTTGGDNNTLVNNGTITTLDELAGMALYAQGGNNTVTNNALIYGNIDLGANLNKVINNGLMVTGTQIQLGQAASLLQNNDVLRPGDTGLAETVFLSSSFEQTDTGITFAELDFTPDTIDQVLAGGTVELDGIVDVALLNTQDVPIGLYRKVLYAGDLGLINNGLELVTAPSVVINYGLVFEPTEAQLEYNIDFAPEGMSANLTQLGQYFNRIQIAGGGDQGIDEVVTKLIYDPDMPTYRNSLSQMSPEFYAHQQVQLLESAHLFSSRMLSCDSSGVAYKNDEAGNCFWYQVEHQRSSTEQYADYKATELTTNRFSLGYNRQFAGQWSLGVGYSAESHDSEGYDKRWLANGSGNQFGLSVAHQTGATQLAAVLSYTNNNIQTHRFGQVIEPFATRLDRKAKVLSNVVSVEHEMVVGDYLLMPRFGAGFEHLSATAAKEVGAGSLNLELQNYSENHAWVEPGIKVARDFFKTDFDFLRVSLDVGVQSYIIGDSTYANAVFQGAPEGANPMTIPVDLNDPIVHTQLAIQKISKDNMVFTFTYQKDWADHKDSDRVDLNVRFGF